MSKQTSSRWPVELASCHDMYLRMIRSWFPTHLVVNYHTIFGGFVSAEFSDNLLRNCQHVTQQLYKKTHPNYSTYHLRDYGSVL